MTDFVFGTCTTPNGSNGKWTIDEITVSKEEADRDNLRNKIKRTEWLNVKPGTYKRLRRGKTVVMSNTPMETLTCMPVWTSGTGRVLVNGLGMGMIIEALLAKPDVRSIKVIELDDELIDLVQPHFQHAIDSKRLEIVHHDAYTYKLRPDDIYDYAWHDIWDDISADNLKDMARLTAKWRTRAKKQGVWSQEQARDQAQEARRSTRGYSSLPFWLQDAITRHS